MTAKQLSVLNALVTFAAENIPGGLSADEREVAQIVGRWTLNGRILYAASAGADTGDGSPA